MTVSGFYRFAVAGNQSIVRDRNFYLKGSKLGAELMVKSLARTIFYLLANIFTIGLSETYRDSLRLGGKDTLIGFGVIGIGIAGLLSPQTVNQKFFGLRSDGIPIQ